MTTPYTRDEFDQLQSLLTLRYTTGHVLQPSDADPARLLATFHWMMDQFVAAEDVIRAADNVVAADQHCKEAVGPGNATAPAERDRAVAKLDAVVSVYIGEYGYPKDTRDAAEQLLNAMNEMDGEAEPGAADADAIVAYNR